MWKKTILGVALAMSAPPAMASDWRAISIGESDIVFLDFDGLLKTGSQAKAWIWVVSSEAESSEFDNHKQFIQADCEQNTIQTLATSAYLGKKYVRNGGAKPPTYAVPDSAGWTALGALCGRSRDKADIDPISVRDPLTWAESYFSALAETGG